MAHILVTGGAGFIGSHLVERLLLLGERVSIVDNFDDGYDATLKRRNIAASLEHGACRLYECDIRDAAALDAAWCREPVDVVVHLAARGGVRASLKNPTLYADVNVNGTVNVLEAARKRGCGRFIHASSSSVYGNNPKRPFHEDDAVDNPQSPYAATKRAGELLCSTYHRLYDLPMTCLRIFTTFGPRCRPDMAIARFTRLIDEDKPVPMFGEADTRRDFTYVDDIVDGVIRSIEPCAAFRIFNLGASRPITVRHAVSTIAEMLGKEPLIERHAGQPADARITYADISRSRDELGFSPTIDFREGIGRYVAWYQATHAMASRSTQLIAPEVTVC